MIEVGRLWRSRILCHSEHHSMVFCKRYVDRRKDVAQVYHSIIIIIMAVLKGYFSREHIALSYINGEDIELAKTNRLKALRMIENHT